MAKSRPPVKKDISKTGLRICGLGSLVPGCYKIKSNQRNLRINFIRATQSKAGNVLALEAQVDVVRQLTLMKLVFTC